MTDANPVVTQVGLRTSDLELNILRSLEIRIRAVVLHEYSGPENLKITRVLTQPDPSKVREFADDMRDGKVELPIVRRMQLRDAAEAHVLGGERWHWEDPPTLAPDSQH